MNIVFSFASLLLVGGLSGAGDTASLLGVGTGSRMLSRRALMGTVVLGTVVGALVGSARVPGVFEAFAPIESPFEMLLICLISFLGIFPLLRAGCPMTTVQVVVASFAGLRLGKMGLTAVSSIPLIFAWVLSPLLAALMAIVLYKILALLIKVFHVNIFKLDRIIRGGIFTALFVGSALMAANVLPCFGAMVFPLAGASFSFWDGLPLQLVGAVGLVLGLSLQGRSVALSNSEDLFNFSFAPLMAFAALLAFCAVGWLFTFSAFGMDGIGVPLATCQVLMGATLGLSLLYPRLCPSGRICFGMLVCWIGVPFLAFWLSWAIALIR